LHPRKIGDILRRVLTVPTSQVGGDSWVLMNETVCQKLCVRYGILDEGAIVTHAPALSGQNGPGPGPMHARDLVGALPTTGPGG
jgi:hypothetical protein